MTPRGPPPLAPGPASLPKKIGGYVIHPTGAMGAGNSDLRGAVDNLERSLKDTSDDFAGHRAEYNEFPSSAGLRVRDDLGSHVAAYDGKMATLAEEFWTDNGLVNAGSPPRPPAAAPPSWSAPPAARRRPEARRRLRRHADAAGPLPWHSDAAPSRLRPRDNLAGREERAIDVARRMREWTRLVRAALAERAGEEG